MTGVSFICGCSCGIILCDVSLYRLQGFVFGLVGVSGVCLVLAFKIY